MKAYIKTFGYQFIHHNMIGYNLKLFIKNMRTPLINLVLRIVAKTTQNRSAKQHLNDVTVIPMDVYLELWCNKIVMYIYI